MPEITIQQATFERLQRYARPLIDTPDSVIQQALDALEQLAGGHTVLAPVPDQEHRIDQRRLPKLTHTKILDASIDGESIPKANWNSLLDEVLRRAMKRVGNIERLRKLCAVNMVKGRKEDEGYSYAREVDLSVQGQDANGACRALVMLAQALGMTLEIGFMWRLKEGASHPGERARIHIGGTKNDEGQS